MNNGESKKVSENEALDDSINDNNAGEKRVVPNSNDLQSNDNSRSPGKDRDDDRSVEARERKISVDQGDN